MLEALRLESFDGREIPVQNLGLAYSSARIPQPERVCDEAKCTGVPPGATGVVLLACGHRVHDYCLQANGGVCKVCNELREQLLERNCEGWNAYVKKRFDNGELDAEDDDKDEEDLAEEEQTEEENVPSDAANEEVDFQSEWAKLRAEI